MPDIINWPVSVLALAFGYLLGSIPFGVVLTRIAGTEDLRSIGSGSIGATNVLRTGRKGLAVATMLGDALKGTAAVLIAGFWGPWAAIIAGLGAFLGHLFPVWLKFKGGKGVATYLGILLGLWWPGVLMFAAVWLTTAFLTRYSSLSALLTALVIPVVLFAQGLSALAGLFVVLTILIFVMHRANISRLVAGTEGKIGQKG
jgi:acyl phosphate:glycerol-3-phosphate acyltransferase